MVSLLKTFRLFPAFRRCSEFFDFLAKPNSSDLRPFALIRGQAFGFPISLARAFRVLGWDHVGD